MSETQTEPDGKGLGEKTDFFARETIHEEEEQEKVRERRSGSIMKERNANVKRRGGGCLAAKESIMQGDGA